MQGTLRSLVNQVLYDESGEPHPADYQLGVSGLRGMGAAFIKGTLFMQHPQLDKGPSVATTLTNIYTGQCAYEARDGVYDALTDAMLKRLPVFLDKRKRTALVEQATREKAELDVKPYQRISELQMDQFATWQGQAIGIPDDSKPWGVDVIQNAIVNPQYFRHQMRRFFPGTEAEFGKVFNEVYGKTLDKLAEQQDERLTDPWARLYLGKPGATIRQYDPKTGKVKRTFSNPPERK